MLFLLKCEGLDLIRIIKIADMGQKTINEAIKITNGFEQNIYDFKLLIQISQQLISIKKFIKSPKSAYL